MNMRCFCGHVFPYPFQYRVERRLVHCPDKTCARLLINMKQHDSGNMATADFVCYAMHGYRSVDALRFPVGAIPLIRDAARSH